MRGYPTSCTTPVAEGMVVHTQTEALLKLRRNILALIMSEHPSACLVCGKRELCEQYRPDAEKAGRTTGCHTCSNKAFCDVRVLAEELQFCDLPVPPTYHQRPLHRSDPFVDRDLNLCILCGRCVRICQHHYGTGVIDFVGRGSKAAIGTAFGRSLQEAGCRFCGSCVDVCPTGALADRYAKWYPRPDRVTESTCIFCDQACAMKLEAQAGRLISAQAVNEAIPLCVLGRFATSEFLNGPDRLAAPYHRVGQVLRQSEWAEALAVAADRLKCFVGDGFVLVCDTTSSLEDRHVFKKFTTDVMKSRHYVEATPDEQGLSRASLPAGAKAVLLAGDLVRANQLDGLDFLLVMDCYPTETSRRADVVLPVAIFAETVGTVQDRGGRYRPLHRACDAPGLAQAQWQSICQLAQTMGASGFDYASIDAMRRDMGITPGELLIERDQAPPAAQDVRHRRTHFHGHLIEDKVRALRELRPSGSPAPSIARGKPTRGFLIKKKHEIAPNTHEIVIAAPEVAKKAQAGQFVIVMVDETSERVPYTLCNWDAQDGTITLVVLEKGQSSRKLILSHEGDVLAHVTGPLGVPLDIRKYGRVVLTGGCYGLGAIVPVAKAMKEAGNHVTAIVEARSHYLHYYGDELRRLCDVFVQTTIDGSLNIKGHSMDVVAQMLKGGETIDLVVAVGCPFMMMLTAQETRPFGVKTLASLNPIMLDGTGMCGACRITVGEQVKFACVDGPFFDAHLVDWNEVRDRRAAYSAEETHSLGRTESVVAGHGHRHSCTCTH